MLSAVHVGKMERVCSGSLRLNVGRPIIGFLVFRSLSPQNMSSAWRKATLAAAVASGYLPALLTQSCFDRAFCPM